MGARTDPADYRDRELYLLTRSDGPDDRELPWLGDIDRRDDDDVEFADEGEYAG